MQPSFKNILFHQTLVIPTILEGRGRLISCEKKYNHPCRCQNYQYSIYHQFDTSNFQEFFLHCFLLIFDEKTENVLFSVVVVFLDAPMHFYLGQNSRNLLRVSNFVVRQVSKTNNREDLHNYTLYNERVTSVRWQKDHFHTLYCY